MAQQRNCVVYEETADSHLKLVGKLFDQVWMIVLNANLNNKIWQLQSEIAPLF